MEAGPDTAVELMPWHAQIWPQAVGQLAAAQAMLMQGRLGDGAAGFVRRLAQARFCVQSQSGGMAVGMPCGACTACRQIAQDTFPDLFWVQAEDATATIRIDAIRALNAWAVESAHAGGMRLAVILLAEQLNEAAANALLKTLEEPPGQVHFVLVTERWGSVLPTLRSRCQRLRLPVPSMEAGLRWLQHQCLEQEENALQQALRLHDQAPLSALHWLAADGWTEWQQWRRQMNQLRQGQLSAPDIAEQWSQWPVPHRALDYFYAWTVDRLRQQPTPALFSLQQTLIHARAALMRHANVTLALEQVLLRYLELMGS